MKKAVLAIAALWPMVAVAQEDSSMPQRGQDDVTVTEEVNTSPGKPIADGAVVHKRVIRHPELIESEGSDAIPALPLMTGEMDGIQYASGGVSDEELSMLKSIEHNYNVRLLMSAKSGAYIGGAMVRVLDAKDNELLSLDDVGPYVYFNLTPGKYTFDITAKQGGIKKVPVSVPSSGSVKPVVQFSEM